jgi:hypothetical protein
MQHVCVSKCDAFEITVISGFNESTKCVTNATLANAKFLMLM